MKIGIQSISWGTQIDDFAAFAKSVREAGYDGVEISQKTRHLCPPSELRAILDDAGIALVGLAGGSLIDRASFAEFAKPVYLYCDECDVDAITSALDESLTVALHPHYHKPIESVAQALPLLERFPALKLILDTAHSYLVGDRIVDLLRRHIDRVVAVHLKDWTNRYGRSPYRFARGFTPLGEGMLEETLQQTVRWLADNDFDGWVIVEQDTPHGEPVDCAVKSRTWLRCNGI